MQNQNMIPICLTEDVTRKIISGEITTMLQPVEPQPEREFSHKLGIATEGNKKGLFGFGVHECGGQIHFVKPPCLAGDTICVREPWKQILGHEGYKYKADSDDASVGGWLSAVIMPPDAERLFLHVVSVKVEKLLDVVRQDSETYEALREANKNGNPWVWVIEILAELKQ